MNKGQLNSIDLLISTTIFILLLVFIVSFWSMSIINMQNTVSKNQFEESALTLSDLLLKSKGSPQNWELNTSQIQSIGLANSPNNLNENKIANFTSLDYTTAKQLLGIDYEFYFYIEDLSQNRLYSMGNFTQSDQIFAIERFAILENENIKMVIAVHG